MAKGPFDCYLVVDECRWGERYYKELKGDDILDLEEQLDKWIEEEFSGELVRDGELMPRLEGDFYARIVTDWGDPDGCVCWESGGFYLKAAD